jgi:hypothetical protein
MDRSLARGYAQRYLDGLMPHKALLRWNPKAKLHGMARSFGMTAKASRPDTALRRLEPLLAPVFPTPEVMAWTAKRRAELATWRITSAPSSAVLHPDDPGRAMFDEPSAFLSGVRLLSRPDPKDPALMSMFYHRVPNVGRRSKTQIRWAS